MPKSRPKGTWIKQVNRMIVISLKVVMTLKSAEKKYSRFDHKVLHSFSFAVQSISLMSWLHIRNAKETNCTWDT